MRGLFGRTQVEANQTEDWLVATEETGTKTGRQIRAVAPRAHQAV